ncbi:HEPN domain-containing protein [Burkholderia orbicola]|uniref:ApeA N-terminal domain 1-containing protein n=1 Tax=Burkholderia orbicola TaxID=2978683 RepID=UPI0035C71FFA
MKPHEELILTTKILEERGYFWWNDTPLPGNHFAPPEAITGTLSIDESGRIRLKLDNYFDNEHGPMAVLVSGGQELPPDRTIQGRLIDSNKCVLLLNLRRRGGRFSSNGVSFDGFAADYCLISRLTKPFSVKPILFDAMDVDMDGFEGWLRLGNIETKRTRSSVAAKHRLPKPCLYELGDCALSVRYDILAPFPSSHVHRSYDLRLVESAFIRVKYKQKRSLDEMLTEYRLVQDLFILLTGSNYSLSRPRLKTKRGVFDVYFYGQRRSAEMPEWRDCWTNFIQLRESFGRVFDAWRQKHSEFGPGFYLYLGTRRGMQLYVEHRFVNLIWGLESLHRRKEGNFAPAPKLQEKIQRILGQVANKRDRSWLEGRLKNASEPSLQERLFEMFRALPFDFSDVNLQNFCAACAKARNDISHFGGQRHAGQYQDFVKDVAMKAEAVAYMYHALLLKEIGVDTEQTKQWLFDGPKSHEVLHAFRETGLLV